jgi:hypothetical protein
VNFEFASESIFELPQLPTGCFRLLHAHLIQKSSEMRRSSIVRVKLEFEFEGTSPIKYSVQRKHEKTGFRERVTRFGNPFYVESDPLID